MTGVPKCCTSRLLETRGQTGRSTTFEGAGVCPVSPALPNLYNSRLQPITLERARLPAVPHDSR